MQVFSSNNQQSMTIMMFDEKPIYDMSLKCCSNKIQTHEKGFKMERFIKEMFQNVMIRGSFGLLSTNKIFTKI